MKNVLVIHYSQSGQLTKIAERFAQPLIDAPDISVTFEGIRPRQDYPFPWPFFRFLDTFPESVYLDPPEMQPSMLSGDEDFDLIILAYQVWFLSPSLPITGFLKSEIGHRLLAGKPVVTLIACRNMWLMAQEEVKKLLAGIGARLVGNVALVDEAGSIWSFLATPLWVLTGNKGPRWGGLIPRAGVSDAEIRSCDRFGERIRDRIAADQPLTGDLLSGLGAVEVDEKLIFSEKAARRGFRAWGYLLRKLGSPGAIQRKPVLIIYLIFLVSFILVVVPISMLVKRLLAPISQRRIQEQKIYFSQPSGH